MKMFLFLALALSSSLASAQALPAGSLTISIIKGEYKVVDNIYKRVTSVLCEVKLPFNTQRIREQEPGESTEPTPVPSKDVCVFVDNGKQYTIRAAYGAFLVNKSVTPNSPRVDLLQFLGGLIILDQNNGTAPFPRAPWNGFTTKDLHAKSVIIEVVPELNPCETTDSSGTCNNFKTTIEAVFDYDIH